jgi:hypothetical protein
MFFAIMVAGLGAGALTVARKLNPARTRKLLNAQVGNSKRNDHLDRGE